MRELEELVSKAKAAQQYDKDGRVQMPELEVRFFLTDMKTMRHSTSSLPPAVCEPVCTAFDKSSHWHSSKEWELSHVYMFTVDNEEYRTEAKFPSEEKSQVATLQKQRVARLDLAVAPTVPLFSTSSSPPTVGVRVSVANEVPTDASKLPWHVTPTQVFVKHRRTFWFTSSKGAQWMYTLTKRWGGKTLEEAYTAQQAQPDVGIEVEIELIDAAYLQTQATSYIAKSLLCKVQDVLALIDPSLVSDRYNLVAV